MPEVEPIQNILPCRQAVDIYRLAHQQLYSMSWHKGIPEEHTPLLNIMLDAFKEQGFNSAQEFFDASELENIKELGFKDRAGFDTRATQTQRETLNGMWH